MNHHSKHSTDALPQVNAFIAGKFSRRARAFDASAATLVRDLHSALFDSGFKKRIAQ
jgi:hypothetical protein